jgi:O-antigen/teichoic acid export membrane protein
VANVSLANNKRSLKWLLEGLSSDSLGAILVRGASGTLVVKALSTVLMFGLQILLARLLGGEQFGIYVYVLTWVNVLVLIGKLGWDTALLRYVAVYSSNKVWGAVRGILRRSSQVTLLASLTVSGVGAFIIWALRDRLGPDLTNTFIAGWLVLPILCLSALRQAALRALSRVVLAHLPEFVFRPIIVAIIVIVFVAGLGRAINGPSAMCLYFISVLITFGVGSYWLHRFLPAGVMKSTPVYYNKEWIAVALPLFLVAGMYLINSQADTLMIGLLLDNTEAGIYVVASRVASLIGFGILAVNSIAAPMIASLYGQDRTDELQRILILGTWGTTIFALPVSLGLIIWGKVVLGLFGPEFSEGYTALVILVIGQLVNAATGLVGSLMQMSGQQVTAFRVIGGSAIANIILNALLIPKWGIEGAAITTATTTIAWSTILVYAAWRRLGVNAMVKLRPSL